MLIECLAVRLMKTYLINLEESRLGFKYWVNIVWYAFAVSSKGLNTSSPLLVCCLSRPGALCGIAGWKLPLPPPGSPLAEGET